MYSYSKQIHQRPNELSIEDKNELKMATSDSDFVNKIMEKLYSNSKKDYAKVTPAVAFKKYIKGSKGFKQIQGNKTLF